MTRTARNGAAPPAPAVTELLAQADVLLLAAGLFRAPAQGAGDAPGPDAAACAELAERAGAPALGPQLAAAVAAAGRAEPARRLVEHARLFESAGLCPPNETAIVRRDKGAILADVKGFYRAFGFDLDPAAGEKPDHVVCELEFVALLLVMLANATEAGEAEAAAVTADALAAFAADHLDAWLPAFCAAVTSLAPGSIHAAAAAALGAAWAAVSERRGLPRASAPASGAPGAVDDDEGPIACEFEGRPPGA